MVTFSPDALVDYCATVSSVPSEVCQALQEQTVKSMGMSAHMLSGPLVGTFLGFVVRLLPARRILDLGTFTGYSALVMAESAPSDAKVYTVDIDSECVELAHTYWAKSKHGGKIESHLCGAKQAFEKIPGQFDLVFLDEAKINYQADAALALERLAPGGILIADNCLWGGKVLDSTPLDAETRAIQKFNQWVHANPHLLSCLLPIRDGLFLIQKRENSKGQPFAK